MCVRVSLFSIQFRRVPAPNVVPEKEDLRRIKWSGLPPPTAITGAVVLLDSELTHSAFLDTSQKMMLLVSQTCPE